MKQQLYINQINYFLAKTKAGFISAAKQREDKDLTEISYKFTKSRLSGALQALDFDLNKDIQDQIMNNIVMYLKAENDMKGKINYLDNNDKNFPLFYLIAGALSISFILLTISDNAQSCCPINKEIILNQTIFDLENRLQTAIATKDKPKIKEIKEELVIMTKMYKDNLQFLEPEKQIA